MSVKGVFSCQGVTEYPVSAASRTHCRVQVIFPGTQPRLSNPIQAADNFDLEYETEYEIDTLRYNAYDKLISEPLKITLFSVSADARHQTAAFDFSFYLDELVLQSKTEIQADLMGKHSEEGEFDVSIPAPSLHFSFVLDQPVISEEASSGSAILKLKAEELKPLPPSVLAGTLHPDDQVHPFDYFVSILFPCGRIIQVPPGSFIFSEPPVVKWDQSLRIFLTTKTVDALIEENSVVNYEVFRALNEDYSHFPITDCDKHLIIGRGKILSSEITKPGQTRFHDDLPLEKYQDEELIRPSEEPPTPDATDAKGNKAAKKAPPKPKPKKVKKPITAKDKKQFKTINSGLSDLTSQDGFDGTQKVTLDFQFSRPLVLKPLVPHSQKKPSDLRPRSSPSTNNKLNDSTAEFREILQKFYNEIVIAQKARQELQLQTPDFPDDLVYILNRNLSYHSTIEQLKSSISKVFSEYVVSHNPQSENDLRNLQAIFPMFLNDEQFCQLPDIFIDSNKPGIHPEFLIKEAKEAFLIGEIDQALEYYIELLALDLTNVDSWWKYSKFLLRNLNYFSAEETIRRGLSLNPSHLKLSIAFASILTRQEKFREAINFLQSGHFEQEIIQIILKVLSGLANVPIDGLDKEIENPLVHAQYLMKMEEVIFAEQLISLEQVRQGETAEVLAAFGQLYYHLKIFNKAVSYFIRSSTLDNNMVSYLNLGHVEFERKRFKEAIKWYEQGLQNFFDQLSTLRLGIMYLKVGQYLNCEQTLFQCNPQSSTVLLGLAISAEKLGKDKQADEFFNQALVINFRKAEAWAHYALFCLKLERQEEAEHAASMTLKWNLRDDELQKELIQKELAQA